MTTEEIFDQATSKSIQSMLTRINGFDDNLTIGQIKASLSAMLPNREEEEKREIAVMTKKLKDATLKITFSPEHICFLRIDSFKVYPEFGEMNADIKGEVITSYKGSIDIKPISGNWGQYSYNQGEEKISVREFNKIRMHVEKAKNLF